MKEEFVSNQLYEYNNSNYIDEAMDIINGIETVLKPRERYVLGLRMDGYTYREIANILDRSVERVRQIIMKCYRKISRKMARSW